MNAVELRPLPIGEVLDVAIKIVWRHARTLIPLVFLIVAPVQILAALIQASALPDAFTQTFYGTAPPDEFEPVDEDEIWVAVVAFVLAIVLGFLATTIAVGACFKAVADAYLGERPSVRTSAAYAARRVHSLMWLIVLYYVLVFLGALLLLVPGVWLGVAWVTAIPALLTEGVRGRRALGRSYRLVRGRWWPTFAITLLAFLIAGFVTYVVQMLFVALLFSGVGENATAVLAVNALASIFGSVLWTPLIAAFTSVLYFDLRVRKEGFDLALLAERIGVAPDPSRPSLAPQPPAPPAWGPAGAGAAPAGSEQPPYWPPPPGWRPSGASAEERASDPDQPPYWPPPPGWAPRSRESETE